MSTIHQEQALFERLVHETIIKFYRAVQVVPSAWQIAAKLGCSEMSVIQTLIYLERDQVIVRRIGEPLIHNYTILRSLNGHPFDPESRLNSARPRYRPKPKATAKGGRPKRKDCYTEKYGRRQVEGIWNFAGDMVTVRGKVVGQDSEGKYLIRTDKNGNDIPVEEGSIRILDQGPEEVAS